MDHAMPNSHAQDARLASSVAASLGVNEQSCNECKRRKGRCDRELPECGACRRNKRHCLYLQHCKTPLTRKYLTEIEACLRQTKAQLQNEEERARLAENRLQDAQAELDSYRGTTPGATSQMMSSHPPPHTTIMNDPEASTSICQTSVDPHNVPSVGQDVTGRGGEAAAPAISGIARHVRNEGIGPQEFELTPTSLDDFSWNEKSDRQKCGSQYLAGDISGDSPSSVNDSMASLSIHSRRTGYLGVASGAAMLRFLVPSVQHKHSEPSLPATRRPSADLNSEASGWVPTSVWNTRCIHEIDVDAAINAYFSMYHLSYPIVHEPTFRAQYDQVIPRPSGRSWNALAYIVAAIGMFTTATEPGHRDLDLLEAAKSNLSIDSLETGNITLVQALALISNYIQKRGKPNSGYNYLGLALHVAMGLGLHKESRSWQNAPLQMEIRRRVWWTLLNFYVGAAITFGRPLAWPERGVEVAMPLNIHDRDLTNVSTTPPPPQIGLTTHSGVAAQARFHLATNEIYSRIISVPLPSAVQLLKMDDERVATWQTEWEASGPAVEKKFELSRRLMEWRYRNLRVIMYRPFVIRQALKVGTEHAEVPLVDNAGDTAVERCMFEAKSSIVSISDFWGLENRTRMASWYSLYFLFQASMIPCVCLRNRPASDLATDWQNQLTLSLNVMQSMFDINPASRECYEVLSRLCSGYLPMGANLPISTPETNLRPVEESPLTQLEGLYPMMWPGADNADIDMLGGGGEGWNDFIDDIPIDTTAFLG